jgi:hypothetical protein
VVDRISLKRDILIASEMQEKIFATLFQYVEKRDILIAVKIKMSRLIRTPVQNEKCIKTNHENTKL